MRGPSEFIACPDGRSIHVQECASGGGPPCLFIHGFAEGGHVWHPFIASTALRRHRLLTVDLPGHAESSWVTADHRYEPSALVTDIVHVIDRLDLTKLIVVGHSLGGNLALRVTQARADRVSKVVAIDTPIRSNPVARKHLLAELEKFTARSYTSIGEYAELLSAHRPLMAPSMIRYMAAQALRQDDTGRFQLKLDPRVSSLLSDREGEDLGSIAAQIGCPALIVRGGVSGVLSQSVAEEWTRLMPRARLRVVPGAGHSVMLDNIFGFRESIEPFLESPYS